MKYRGNNLTPRGPVELRRHRGCFAGAASAGARLSALLFLLTAGRLSASDAPLSNSVSQRETARTAVSYRHPWVLAIDADETPDEELVAEIRALGRDESCPHAAFRMRRKDHFMGRWIKRSTLYPSWFIRLYRPHRISYASRAVHEYPTINGSTGVLKGHLLHFSFNKGLSDWVQKHTRYAQLEAEENLRALTARGFTWHGIASRDPVVRRKALKELSFRLHCRPMLRFLYMYAFRLGLLDGVPGFHYCRLMAIYEYMIVLKIKEIERRRSGLPF